MIRYASHSGIRLTCEKTLNPKAKVIVNKKSNKVGIVGEASCGNIKFFKVNIKKWMWADCEGFSMQDVNDNKLRKEVFEEIYLDKPIDNFQIARMVKELK